MDDVDTIIEILRKDDDADLPPELVLDTAATLSRNIFTHWHRLNAIVQRHEGAIRIRWRRKSPAKRRELLQVVFPGIPDLHRPDVDNMHGNFTDCPCGQPYHAATSSELRPYINSEDLLDAKSLLVFINARARNRPASGFLRLEDKGPNLTMLRNCHDHLPEVAKHTSKSFTPAVGNLLDEMTTASYLSILNYVERVQLIHNAYIDVQVF
jgi:hypothetical protein